MHPLVQVKHFMIFLRMRKKLLLKITFFGSTLFKKIGKAGSLKYLSVICQMIKIIKTNMDSYKKGR